MCIINTVSFNTSVMCWASIKDMEPFGLLFIVSVNILWVEKVSVIILGGNSQRKPDKKFSS